MEFKTKAVEQCYNTIRPWMKEIFGEFSWEREDAPRFSVMVGSAKTEIAVFPWGEDDSVISVRSWVVTGVEVTPDLMEYLLKANDEMRFGGFGLDKDKDIFFEHSIVGSTCQRNELKASALAVVMVADDYDDKIIARWGGQRAIDRR